jgi:Asp-tRNA(Asn)/Glu-tRNA(Gln) amidotransferase C subunit
VPQPTKELIRTLAEANGLAIPEERLELVLRQYESFLRSLDQINTLPLPLEAEPAIIFGHPSTAATLPGRGGRED